MVNFDSSEPYYEQVKSDINTLIQTGEFPSGSRIPSENELARHYGVSIITIRRAVSELVDDGVLEKKQGKGTFVLRKTFNKAYSYKAQSFTETCRANGMEASAKLLRAEIVPKAPKEILRKLDVPEDSQVVHIERLRYADGNPIVIETCWFSMHYIYLLNEDLNNKSMFEVIKSHENGMTIVNKPQDRVIRLAQADAETADLLKVKKGTTLLAMDSACYNELTGETVHVSGHLGYAEKYNFAIQV